MTSDRSSTRTARLRAWIYLLLIATYLIAQLGRFDTLMPLLSGLSAFAILISLLAAGWIARALSLLFLGAGSWMLWRSGAGLAAWLCAYGEMLYLLALFAVLPILAVPVRLGGYSRAIEAALADRVAGVNSLFRLVTVLAYVCGSFLSLAAVPIMMASIEPVVRRYPIADKVRFTAVSSTFGYVMPILWTPVSGVVGVVLYNLRLDWLALFPTLFLISIAGLAAGWGVFYMLEIVSINAARETKILPRATSDAPESIQDSKPAPSSQSPIGRLLQMVLAIILLLCAIAFLEQLLHIGLITIVTLLAIPFALAWSATIGYGRQAVREVGRQLASRLPLMADQFALFLSAGFFAAAMRLSGFDEQANLMFLRLRDAVGTEVFLLMMPMMALAASFVGVHPLVAIALLRESLKPDVLGITSVQLAVTLIGSSLMTYMLGPFSGTLGLVQSVNGVSTYRLSLWNVPYAAAYFAVFCLAIWTL
jgi:hypothetical protein